MYSGSQGRGGEKFVGRGPGMRNMSHIQGTACGFMWHTDDYMGRSIGRNEAEEVGKGQIACGKPCGPCKRLCTESSTP